MQEASELNETVAVPDEAVNVKRLPLAPDGNGVVPVMVVVVELGSVKLLVVPPVAVRRMNVFAPVMMTAPDPPVVTLRMP